MKARHAATLVSEKAKRLLHAIKLKRKVSNDYIPLPNTDSIPPALTPLAGLSAIDIPLLGSDKAETRPKADTWLDFHPLIDLVQKPTDHPAWSETPFIRGASQPDMPRERRWSYPLHVSSSGAQMQLSAALHRECEQMRKLEGLKTQAQEQKVRLGKKDEMIEDLLLEKGGMVGDCLLLRMLRDVRDCLAAKGERAKLRKRAVKVLAW